MSRFQIVAVLVTVSAAVCFAQIMPVDEYSMLNTTDSVPIDNMLESNATEVYETTPTDAPSPFFGIFSRRRRDSNMTVNATKPMMHHTQPASPPTPHEVMAAIYDYTAQSVNNATRQLQEATRTLAEVSQQMVHQVQPVLDPLHLGTRMHESAARAIDQLSAIMAPATLAQMLTAQMDEPALTLQAPNYTAIITNSTSPAKVKRNAPVRVPAYGPGVYPAYPQYGVANPNIRYPVSVFPARPQPLAPASDLQAAFAINGTAVNAAETSNFGPDSNFFGTVNINNANGTIIFRRPVNVTLEDESSNSNSSYIPPLP